MLQSLIATLIFSTSVILSGVSTDSDDLISAKIESDCVDFYPFWLSLRPEIKERNYSEIAKYTEFPFTIKGIADFIEHKKVSRTEFSKYMELVLDEESYYLISTGYYTTKYELLMNAKSEVDISFYCGENRMSVGEFEFDKIDNT